jgi:hypothetical protein
LTLDPHPLTSLGKDWIEAEELKLPNDCYLSTEERQQQTAVSLAGTGAHSVVSKKNVVFNLLLFNELKQTTELLPCLIARTIPTSIDLIIGLPTIRKHDLVLKIPSHFTNNKSDGFAENVTSCIPAGVNLFETGNGPSGSENLCMTCRTPSEHKNRSKLDAVTELNSRSKVNSGSELNPQSKLKSENSPKVPGQRNATKSDATRQTDEEPPTSKWPIHDPLSWTRMLREVKDVIRVPVDNYQLATLATIKHRSDIIESVDDHDEIEWTEDPYEFKSQPATEGSLLIDLIQIQGPPSLRRSCGLCVKNSQTSSIQPFGRNQLIFHPCPLKSTKRNGSLTNIDYPPEHILWRNSPRLDSSATNCLELGVIRHSTASEWSQVHMVPKPTPGEWRFTLDFVRLNDCTSDLEGWPITLIRPLYFGKLDLTAGSVR